MPIFPAEHLSPGPFQRPLDLAVSIYFDARPRPLGSSKPYLPLIPPPPFRSLLSSPLYTLSKPQFFSLSSSLATKHPHRRRRYRLARTRTFASSRHPARVRRASPSLVCSPFLPAFPQISVSCHRSIENKLGERSDELTNQPYI